ncbi:MAG: hypothetical protein AAF405_08825 [Pseudomonadota bacterium]
MSQTSRKKPKRITEKKQRKLVESAIDRLVQLLDEIDPDPDDEPSLGWPPSTLYPQNPSAGYDTGDNREGYGAAGQYSRLHEGDDEPSSDEEPSLRWADMEARYNRFGYLSGNELEDDQVDGEASLGWQN